MTLLKYQNVKKHHDPKLNDRGYSYFFSFYPFSYAMVIFVRNNIFIVYPHQTQRIFVPKYYHDRRRTNFLKNLRFVGEKLELDKRYFQENQILGKVKNYMCMFRAIITRLILLVKI